MERDPLSSQWQNQPVHFNSHAHVERDGSYAKKDKAGTISTHTLTWSVTQTGKKLVGRSCISTHTLTWSVTIFDNGMPTLSAISTHTLTWSVTAYLVNAIDSRGNFNSHAHVERD